MNLEDAIKLRDFYYLVPFSGWRRAWRLTGRYFYDTVLFKDDPSILKVEIQTSKWFPWNKTWVFLSNIKPILRADA